MPWMHLFPYGTVRFVWVFTPFVNRACTTFLWPLLGIIFLPFTTLMYVLVYHPLVGVIGWGWF